MDHVTRVLAVFHDKFMLNTSLVKRSTGNVSILWNCQKLKTVKVMKITLNFWKELVDHKLHVNLVFSSSSIVF